MTLLLSRMPDGSPEIFESVQGEGASLGLPSSFVRLAVCNLRCSWCDTAYTWDWTRYSRAASILESSVDDVVAAIERLHPRNVVVTGGEPLIQRRALQPLLARLRERSYRIEVETNGTVPPGALAGLVDQWNVSPKLASSGNEGLGRIRPAVLGQFARQPAAFFKFVLSGRDDLDEVQSVVEMAGIGQGQVILMPQGRTRDELERASPWLAAECTARGWRFTTRLHILVWGDRRGV